MASPFCHTAPLGIAVCWHLTPKKKGKSSPYLADGLYTSKLCKWAFKVFLEFSLDAILSKGSMLPKCKQRQPREEEPTAFLEAILATKP